MKTKTKKLIIGTIALVLLCAIFAVMAIFCGYVAHIGVAMEAKMPSMSVSVEN